MPKDPLDGVADLLALFEEWKRAWGQTRRVSASPDSPSAVWRIGEVSASPHAASTA
jgi:hypothetical protein